MSESTLSLTYNTLRNAIGDYLGVKRDYSVWDATTAARVEEIISSGLRQFYFPSAGAGVSHEWFFLSPIGNISTGTTSGTVSGVPVYGGVYSTITATGSVFESRMASFATTITFDTSETAYTVYAYTSATEIIVTGDASGEASGDTVTIGAQRDFDLPDDFGSIRGSITFGSESFEHRSVRIISEYQIRNLRQTGSIETDEPIYAAVRPLAFTGVSGLRYELLVYPTPSSSYTLSYKYNALPNALSTANPYPYGGAVHAETILASCLAIAENRSNDESGVKAQAFQERLRASIEYDKRNAPDYYGYNGDSSIYDNNTYEPYRGRVTTYGS